MRRPILSTLTLLTLMTVPVEAGSAGASRSRPAPIKDCTRFNGRSGYYGNPWCTEREQLIWDRATAARSPRSIRR